tara:strand:- start:256 stop:594 length:339 start_codon:yes stop_codon:yes gene_type:complete
MTESMVCLSILASSPFLFLLELAEVALPTSLSVAWPTESISDEALPSSMDTVAWPTASIEVAALPTPDVEVVALPTPDVEVAALPTPDCPTVALPTVLGGVRLARVSTGMVA